MRARWLAILILVLLPGGLFAHIGSPNVIFEGEAGSYPVRVIIRPPNVIPGLAQINVRVITGQPQQVTVLPVRWDAGKQGAPPPDIAKPVAGETNLFSAELWLMKAGAHSVFVEVHGEKGPGTAIVPLNAVALTRLDMPPLLKGTLVTLIVILVFVFISIFGAAVREARLAPGESPTRRRRWAARFAMVFAGVFITALLVLADRWWAKVDADYLNNRLYQPLEAQTSIRVGQNRQVLAVSLESRELHRHDHTSLIPDHGKLMHLFLIREPGMEAFAHLHPVRLDQYEFETPLPPLPPGSYSVYADVTHESGLARTAVGKIELAGAPGGKDSAGPGASLDSDDSWQVGPPEIARPSADPTPSIAPVSTSLGDGYVLQNLSPSTPRENIETILEFTAINSHGQRASLERYLGMLSHAVVRNEDGSVFTHLHPLGTISMASQRTFVEREFGKAGPNANEDGFCSRRSSQISFPYAFPKAGKYRIWVQVKVDGQVRTGVFDTMVAPN